MNGIDQTQLNPRPSDRFGCQLNKLDINQSATSAGIAIYRKASKGGEVGQVKTEASNGGYLIGLSMCSGHERRLKHEYHTTGHRFENGSIYVRDLANDYSAELRGAFDFMLFEIPRAALSQLSEDSDVDNYSLVEQIATRDTFLERLCHSIAPALSDPEGSNPLFIELMTRAVGAHILQRYGRIQPGPGTRIQNFSRTNLMLAKDYLQANLTGEVSIKDAAASLNMSPALFTKMFRQATGVTPYRWVIQQRVDRAATLLKGSNLSIEEIATSCGFTDQAHLTRVFSTHMGVSPRKWLRNV